MPRLETEDCVGIFNSPNLRRHLTVCIKKASFEIFLMILHVFCHVCWGKLQPGRMTLHFSLLVNPVKGRFF